MSLGGLLEGAEGQGSTAPFDSAEFFGCCLWEGERALVTLTLIVEEAFPAEVGVTSDLDELVCIMNENFQGTLSELSRTRNVLRLLHHRP